MINQSNNTIIHGCSVLICQMMFVFIVIVINEGYWIERAVEVFPDFPVIFIRKYLFARLLKNSLFVNNSWVMTKERIADFGSEIRSYGHQVFYVFETVELCWNFIRMLGAIVFTSRLFRPVSYSGLDVPVKIGLRICAPYTLCVPGISTPRSLRASRWCFMRCALRLLST